MAEVGAAELAAAPVGAAAGSAAGLVSAHPGPLEERVVANATERATVSATLAGAPRPVTRGVVGGLAATLEPGPTQASVVGLAEEHVAARLVTTEPAAVYEKVDVERKVQAAEHVSGTSHS